MSYSNYQQTVIINGYALSGIQSVDGSYGISEKPVKVAGVGFVDALIDSPLEGTFSVNRKMVSRDPLLSTNSLGKYEFDEQEVSGVILYDNDTKGFGFTRGRVSRYSVSCSVGEIPDIQTDITVYGNLGSGVNMNAATQTHPPIQYPDQSSIKVQISDFDIDAISDFSYSRAINMQPIYALPKGNAIDWNAGAASSANLEPIQIDTQYPIETDINVTIIADEYQIREIKDRIQAAPKSDVKIEIRDSFDQSSIINSFTGYNMRLTSEAINSAAEGEMTMSLTYKGYETYHNPVDEKDRTQQYTLTVQGDSGLEIGGGNYVDGSEVILRAIPYENYRFLDWQLTSGDGLIENPISSKTKFTTSFSDSIVTARYTQLYIAYLGGDHGTEIGQAGYDAGDVVNITAIPDKGYRFVEWVPDDEDFPIIDNGDGSHSFTMPSRDISINAFYTLIDYDISIDGTNGSQSSSSATANIGQEITITLNPNEGFELDDIVINEGSITLTNIGGGSYRFIMPAGNVSITALYRLIDYSLSISGVEGNETISATSANFQDTITISSTPYSGYVLQSWSISPNVNITDNLDGTYSFLMPSSNVSIIANYVQIAPVWGSSAQSLTYAENAQVALSYTNDIGPAGVIVGYSISGTDVDSFNINAASGEITFKQSPDYEVKNSYEIIVTAYNNSGSTTKTLAIIISDVADIAPTWGTSSETLSYVENDTIAVAYTNNLNSGDSSVAYSLYEYDKDYFDINPLSGELSFKNAPDYEQKTFYKVYVVATNLTGSSSKLITINISNVIDAAPAWNTIEEDIYFNENSQLALSYTNDLYAGDSAVTYSLGGADVGEFDLSSSAEITFKNAPDYETKSLYVVELIAQNASGSSTKKINVIVVDIPDIPPVWTTSLETISYTENDTSSVIYTSDLNFGDRPVTYSLSGVDAGLFSVSDTGELTFIAPPDYEQKTIYNVYITATSQSGSDSKYLTILISNQEDVAPSWGSNIETVNYTENDTVPVGYTNDLDSGDSASHFDLLGADASHMSISSSGELTFNSPPDYESKLAYNVVIVATNTAGSDSKALTINIQNVLDAGPIWTTNSELIEYVENDTSAVGYTNDVDAGDETVDYSLSGTDSSDFSITNQGVLTFNTAPDYEIKTSYSVEIVAFNNFGSDTKTLSISILPVVDTAPSWATSSQSVSYTENNTDDVIYLNDLDPGDSSISYSLGGVDSSLFNISSTDGSLSFKNAPDYEQKNSYSVNVVATNATGFASKTINITILDVPDVAPSWGQSSESISYQENNTLPVGYTNDLDTGDSAVSYSLTGFDKDLFSINSSGQLSFVAAPDYEQKDVYFVNIRASNSTGSSIKYLTINITNIVDAPPVWSAASESVDYTEGGTHAVFYTNDLYPGDSSVSYSISGTDASSLTMTSAGVLTFNSVPYYNSKTSYTINIVASNASGSDSKVLTINILDVDLLTNLSNDVIVTVSDGYYLFDGVSSQNSRFVINTGTYKFLSVPSQHPIAFYAKDVPIRYGGDYWGGRRLGQDGNMYDYYYGNVILDVDGDFGEISYDCYNHQYMGGERNLSFSSAVTAYPDRTLSITIDYSNYTQNALTSSDRAIIRDVCDQIEEMILTEMNYTLEVEDFTNTSAVGGTLAYAGPMSISTIDGWSTARGSRGTTAIDPADLSNLRASASFKTEMFWVVLHELCHAMGVGPIWNYFDPGLSISPVNYFINLSVFDGAQYVGQNAVREYNSIMNVSLPSLPIQTYYTTSQPSSYYASRNITNNFSTILTTTDISRGYVLHDDPWTPMSIAVYQDSSGNNISAYSAGQAFQYTLYLTWGGHMGELTPDANSSGFRTVDGEDQPLYQDELMTPYYGGDNAPLSRITLGFLHDLSFVVDYSKIQPDS